MKQPFSPLVWLCAVSTLALGAMTMYDPNGVYDDYISSLDDGTPAIAAIFQAAQDGVFPWSETYPENSSSPAYRSLNETVTNEEMRSSVGNNDPFEEAVLPLSPDADKADSPAVASEAPSVDEISSDEESVFSSNRPISEESAASELTETDVSIPQEEPAGSGRRDDGAEDNVPAVSSDFITVDASWFDDALFIGDSHIEGFCDYAGLPNATYYYKRGLDVWSVLDKAFVGGKQTIPQALSTQQFGKIYIMLGINEIGCGTTESFAAQYAEVVSQLHELQPDALIFILAIFHTSSEKSGNSIYNNDTINARNEAVSQIADNEHIFFIDCNCVFDDENGALKSEYTGDGVHVMAPYYTMWRDYLFGLGKEIS